MKMLLTGYQPKYNMNNIKPFDTNLEQNMPNLANGRIILKFNNSVLVQKNSSSLYSNFILNLYIVYKLNNQSSNPSNNFPLKNCLFVTVKLVNNAIKSKFTHNGRGIAIDGGSWSFGNDFARNVVIFGVDNSSPSNNDNRKSNFLVLGDGPIAGINDSTVATEKSIVLTLVKRMPNFAQVYIAMVIKVACM